MYRFEDIRKQYGGQDIPYAMLLNTVEWYERRTPILVRDDQRCRGKSCTGGHGVLQVHHLYYVLGKLPWDYSDDALLTLCKDCHSELHRTRSVPVYEEVDGKLVERNYRLCFRCLGAGWFPQWTHVQGGVCFECWGARFEQQIIVAHVPTLA